jgi:hypothetical protein
LNEIAAALDARSIPLLHLGSLFEGQEIRDLLALVSLAVDPFGDALVRVGAMPRNATAWEFLATYLLDRTDMAKGFGRAHTITERMRAVAIWQFLNFVRDQIPVGGSLPIQRTLDRVRQLVLLAVLSVQRQLVSRRRKPKPDLALTHDCAPLRQCGGASLAVEVSADEVALLTEMVVDGPVDRGEFLQCLHPAKALHDPFSASKRQVRVLDSIVQPAAGLLAAGDT